MPIGRSKRRLPESLTQHLSDPKVVAFRPRTTKQSGSHRGSVSAKKAALSAVTFAVVVLAGGHLLHLW